MNTQYEEAATTGQTMFAREMTIRELELAITSHRGIICALVMFSAVSVRASTVVLTGTVVVLIDSGASPPAVMLFVGRAEYHWGRLRVPLPGAANVNSTNERPRQIPELSCRYAVGW